MLGELIEWTLNLDAGFAFLLALPFLVAIAGYIAYAVENRKAVRKPAARPRTAPVAHPALWSRES